MPNSYLSVPKAKTMLLSPPNPFSNQVTSHKSILASASPNRKDSIVTGFALSIWHWPQDSQGYQKLGHSRSTSPVPRERRMFTKQGDPWGGGNGRAPWKEVDNEVWWVNNDNFKWTGNCAKLRRWGYHGLGFSVQIMLLSIRHTWLG